MRTKKNSGFTLVEILIVVVILGILAAIVIPQFSNASSEANAANCKSNLQTLRSQIALYSINNNDVDPDCSDEAAFALDMVPTYLQSVPVNPLNSLGTILEGATGAAVYDSGWYLDTTTGIMHANDSATSYTDF